MTLATWKLNIKCPKCGKPYLYSDMDIEKGMLMFAVKIPFKGWRFNKVPNLLRCVKCGQLEPQVVPCKLPIYVYKQVSLFNVLILLIQVVILFILAFISIQH